MRKDINCFEHFLTLTKEKRDGYEVYSNSCRF